MAMTRDSDNSWSFGIFGRRLTDGVPVK